MEFERISYASIEDALAGIEIPEDIRATLALVGVPHIDFEGAERTGQLVVRVDLAEEVREIFELLSQERFPIHAIVPVAAYNWNDEASMQDNNTSAFNYRRIISTDRLSNHSHGWAIDINPFYNPYHAHDGNIYPLDSAYDPEKPGTITKDSVVVRIFKERGWTWLGEREEHPDYQHFEKPLN